MDMTAVIQKMLALLLLLALGYACNKLGLMDRSFADRISRLVVNVTMPAVVLYSAMDSGEPISRSTLLLLAATGVGMFCILMALGLTAPWLWRPKREDLGTYRFVTALPNTAFIGYPVVMAMLGSRAVVYAAVLNLPFNLGMFAMGPVLMSGGRQSGFSWRKLANPGVFAALGAIVLVVTGLHVPGIVRDVVGMAGNTATPLAMMVIGSQLADMSLKEVLGNGRVYICCLFRLVILPTAVWLALRGLVSDQMVLGTASVLAAMPTATSATVISVEYGGNEKLASQTVLMSTVLSAATIPLMMYLFFGL